MKPVHLVLFATGLVAGTHLTSASIFLETFDTYAPGALPGTYTTEPTWAVVNDATFGSQVAEGSSFQNNLMTTFASTSLAVNEGLYLQFDYRYTGAPAALPQANFVRFGLYASSGTAAYDDDAGFHADITHYDNATPGTGGFYELRREVNSVNLFAGLLLDNQPGVLTAPPPDSDGSTLFLDPKLVTDGTGVHTARLEIRNLALGTGLRLYVDDFTTPKVSGFTLINQPTFDSILFETPAGTTGLAAFQVDNVTVDRLSAVPEPEEYAALFGAGMVGFALWRRHARATRKA